MKLAATGCQHSKQEGLHQQHVPLQTPDTRLAFRFAMLPQHPCIGIPLLPNPAHPPSPIPTLLSLLLLRSRQGVVGEGA